MTRFFKACFLLLAMLFALAPAHAYVEPEIITVTFRQSALPGSPALTNPQYGVALTHPRLPKTMLTSATTLHFSFESTTTQGDLVFMIKNKQGKEHFGLPPTQQTQITYEEYLQVRIPLSQSGPSYRHTINIGQFIQDTNIGWGKEIYMGFFAEVQGLPGEPASSQTSAYCNNHQFGRPWKTDNLRSPEFSLPVIYDKGTSPNLPTASLSEGSNSHGFTDLNLTTPNGNTIHGAISNYFYELKDNATTGNRLPLGDRIWELYEINTQTNALTLVHSVPGEGDLGITCPFQVPEHTENGTRYLLLCRTVDATGHASMAQPTTLTDPGLGANCFVFEVGKDVTQDSENCLAISFHDLGAGTLTIPSCNLSKASNGRLHVMPQSTGTTPDFDVSPGTQETFVIRWLGQVSQLQTIAEQSIVPIPTTPDIGITTWPMIPTSQQDLPVFIEWQYINAYGRTAFSAPVQIGFQEPDPEPFQARLDHVDWLSLPVSPNPNVAFSLQYQALTPPTVPPLRDVVMATAWIYQIENNQIVQSAILKNPIGQNCFQLTPNDTLQSLDLVLPDAINHWNLDAGAELKIRLKATWRANSLCTDNFLNDFDVLPDEIPNNSEFYALADSSSWLIGGSEPGHFTDLNQGMNNTNQVRLTTNEIDLCLVESHTGNPEPHLAWRWETNVGGNTYLWRHGSWQPANNHPEDWMEINTGTISTGGSDTFSSRWKWNLSSGKIQPKGLTTAAPLAPLPGSSSSLVVPFFTPTANNQVDTLTVTIKVRMFFPGYHEDLAETVTLSLLQPEPGIDGFNFALAKDHTTPACGDDGNWLDSTDYFGRLGNLPRMQFSLTTTGNQIPTTTLRIEKQISDNNFSQVSCFDLNDPTNNHLFASNCQSSPGIGENLQRWWVAEADTDPDVDNLFDVLTSHGPGTYRLRLTTIDCGTSSDSDASVKFTLNPAESFALRIHYRDHIGSSSISRAYTPSLAGIVDNTAPFNLKVGSQSLTLYSKTPEWTHYEPFGKTWGNANSEPDPRYTDHEYDMQTGFNYMKGRYQLPDYGRFNRPDPARDWDWENPSSINLYQYVRNRPIDSWDPYGLFWSELKNFLNGYGWVSDDEIEEAKEVMEEQENETLEDPIEVDHEEVVIHNRNDPKAYTATYEGRVYFFDAKTDEYLGDTHVFQGAVADGIPTPFMPAAGMAGIIARAEARAIKPTVRINLIKGLKGQWHHIATDKSIKSGITLEFKKLFAQAGMKLTDKSNLVYLFKHEGRHVAPYHQYIMGRLKNVMEKTKGFSVPVRQQALRQELQALRVELVKNPHILYTK